MSNLQNSTSFVESELNVNSMWFGEAEATPLQMISSADVLAKGVEALAKALRISIVRPMQIPQIYKEQQDDFDTAFYDNKSMCEHLHVSERTLQRYRKAGKIKSFTIKGKVYYPKDFLVQPGEVAPSSSVPTAYCRTEQHKKVVPQARVRPRSKIIDLHRLNRLICRCRWDHRQYDSAEVIRIRKLHQAARWEKGKDLHLWPKKIKFVSLPFKKPKTLPKRNS